MMDHNTSGVVDHRPFLMVTAGLIVRNDSKGITIAQDCSEEGTMRDKSFIPRGMIRQVKVAERGIVVRQPRKVAMKFPKKVTK